MKLAVRYYSRSGSTKKLADAIAKEAGVTAKTVEEGLNEPVDILFVGGSPYVGSALDEHLKKFLQSLTSAQVKHIAFFSSSNWKMSMRGKVKKELTDAAIIVLEDEFACRGALGIINSSHPNEQDLEQAADFVKIVIKNTKGAL